MRRPDYRCTWCLKLGRRRLMARLVVDRTARNALPTGRDDLNGLLPDVRRRLAAIGMNVEHCSKIEPTQTQEETDPNLCRPRKIP